MVTWDQLYAEVGRFYMVIKNLSAERDGLLATVDALRQENARLAAEKGTTPPSEVT